MSRPADLPPPEAFRHGTRGRYVSGCRCAPCRAANTASYHERRKRHAARAVETAAERAALLAEHPVPGLARTWTPPGGTPQTRVYKNACPGVHGKPCPRGSYVRKDSPGGLCGACRAALAWNGLVGAGPARRHLLRLSRAGVGRDAVSAACDVSTSVLGAIRARQKYQIMARTAERILAVDAGAVADAGLVPAAPTWRLLRRLLREGFTKGALAQRLGCKRAALQIRRGRIRARTRLRVERLYRTIMAGGESPRPKKRRTEA